MTDYYVSVYGNNSDNGLTPNTPWESLQYATDHAYAGDTVYIMAGTYAEQINGVHSGTLDNCITFTNYNEEQAIIDGSWMTSTWDGLVSFKGQHHIRISGLKIVNSSAYGLFFPGSEGHTNDINIDNCEIYGHSLSGIYFYPANPNYVENVLIENNIIHDCQNWWNHTGIGPNETVTISNVDGFIFRNNYLYNNHKLPVDIKNNSRNGQVYGNTMDTAHALDHGGGGFYIDAYDDDAMDIDIFGNIVYGPETGYTLGTEQGGTLHRIRLFNNIYYGTGHAFQINDHWQFVGGTPGVNHVKEDCCIINNTISNASVGLFITDLQESFYNFVVRNNIFSADIGDYLPLKAVDLSTQSVDHNLFDETQTSTYYGTDHIQANPQFMNPNNDFHLQPISPCINMGNILNAPVKDFDGIIRGSQVDIGAYEYIKFLVDDHKEFTIHIR